ncbi:MAG TPA: hypothetical protein VFM05_06805, partial [Candidatus Saccharimonadales bacterium]|nr:hypothetical protein [Candidatus Saccharimonadales bacterium]
MSRVKSTSLLFSSLLAITILLTSLGWSNFAEVAHAESPDRLPTSQRNKVSVLLKGNQRQPEERVTVIVTLNGAKSGRLNAFLAQNQIRLRREMKS